jgi:hypothetical protein
MPVGVPCTNWQAAATARRDRHDMIGVPGVSATILRVSAAAAALRPRRLTRCRRRLTRCRRRRRRAAAGAPQPNAEYSY